MKKSNSILFVLLALFLSCDDVFEEDITDDLIQIISPANGSVIEGNTTNFSWTSLDGVDDYRIQIIDESQISVLDSLVSSNTFTYNLLPGNYQWRVKGENFAYQTEYTFPVNFVVEPLEDLTNQDLVLLLPDNAVYTNNDSFTFTWQSITTADSYTFELIKNDGGQQIVSGFPVTGITDVYYSVTDTSIFDVDAEYIWKVKALNTNTTTETQYSQRSLFIDRVVPNQPVLDSPSNLESFTTTTITFSWTNGVDTGNLQSAITNTIEIASDSDFNNIINTSNTESNSYIYEFTSNGTYYWRVKASDLASNESEFSVIRTLEIE